MSRYIDAEWLIKESMPLSFSVQKWVNEVQIITAPSIDIVRCGECKHRGMDNCPMCNECGRNAYPTSTDDFCSHGERREP